MLKGLAGLGSLMKQAQEIGGRMQGISEELKGRRATGSAGGGMVEIEVNGLVEVLACRIDEQLIQQGDRELLEDLVATATNQAVTKAKQLHAEVMKEVTGGMDLPGLESAMGKFFGSIEPDSAEDNTPQE